MSARRAVMTGVAQSTPGNQQPDFGRGWPCRPVRTHDEAAGGGNRTLQRASGKRTSLSRERRRQSARLPIVTPCEEAAAEEFNGFPLLQGAERHAQFLACVADAGYRHCSCPSAEREAESHAYKSILFSVPRELMPNPSLKRSANGSPPGPVRGAVAFSSARAWRAAVVARLARTLGVAKTVC